MGGFNSDSQLKPSNADRIASENEPLVFLLFAIGWGTFWSWPMFITDSSNPIGILPYGSKIIGLVCASGMTAFVIARILFAILSPLLNRHLSKKRFALLSITLMIIGATIISIACCIPTETRNYITVVGSAILATGSVLMSCAWLCLYAHIRNTNKLFVCILLGFLVTVFIRLTMPFMPPAICLAFSALLPAASYLAYIHLLRLIPNQQSFFVRKLNWSRKYAKQKAPCSSISMIKRTASIAWLMIGIFCYGIAGSAIMRFLISDTTADAVDPSLVSSGHVAGIGVCALCVCSYVLMRIHGEKLVFLPSFNRVILSIMALGMIIPGLFSGTPLLISNFIIGIAVGCFEMILLTYAAIVSRDHGASPFLTLGVAYGPMEAASALAWPITGFISNEVSSGTLEWSHIALTALFIFIIVSMTSFSSFNHKILRLMQNGHDRESPMSSGAEKVLRAPSEEEVQRSLTDALRNTYGLTNREAEVALLLAEGRNIPYIQNRLSISQGTAQTHARHIYQKMDIHSKQELIDLVGEEKEKKIIEFM